MPDYAWRDSADDGAATGSRRVATLRRKVRAGGGRRRRRSRWRPVVVVAIMLGILVPAGAWFLQEDPAHSLAAPGDARVDETAATMLRVSWVPVARTDYYEVALIPADKKSPRKTVRSATSETQVPALKAGVDYTVRVRAVVGASKPHDVTPYSRPITARTEDPTQSALLTPRAFTVRRPRPARSTHAGRRSRVPRATRCSTRPVRTSAAPRSRNQPSEPLDHQARWWCAPVPPCPLDRARRRPQHMDDSRRGHDHRPRHSASRSRRVVQRALSQLRWALVGRSTWARGD